jgi:transcriptional regulator with XRE-family HTH domain
MLIGQRIKELRSAKKISLTELSQKSGIQLATLSRIENLKMTGTLESHLKIAEILGVSLPELYSGITRENKEVELKSPEPDFFIHSEKSAYEILTNKMLSKKMLPAILRLDAGGKTAPEQNPVGSEKFVFVLEGVLEVTIENKTYHLTKNNSLYFDASLKYQFINKGRVAVKAICVTTPVAL